jgi:hypothetical protein
MNVRLLSRMPSTVGDRVKTRLTRAITEARLRAAVGPGGQAAPQVPPPHGAAR